MVGVFGVGFCANGVYKETSGNGALLMKFVIKVLN